MLLCKVAVQTNIHLNKNKKEIKEKIMEMCLNIK